jgi:tyrosine kinase receptor 1
VRYYYFLPALSSFLAHYTFFFVAARNVMLAENLHPKIGDFGMSRRLDGEDGTHKTVANVGPLLWMAPESLNYSEYSSKSDVWAFGNKAMEILTRKRRK